jgi:hypothetical protein
VNNPAVTILVALDSPVGPHHGGPVAGPVFRRIAQQVLSYLDVPHDLPVAPEAESTRLRSAPDESHVEEGIAAPTKAPPRGAAGAPELSAPTMALGDSEGVPVPQLIGQSVRGVTEACSRLGLTPLLVGSGVAVEQSPEAGTRVVRGSRISVRFGRAAAVPVAAPEPEPEKEQ